MEIINRRHRMISVARKVRREPEKTIGLVPTMGALHEGHLSLVREARRLCDIVVVSIFVNPTQFGKGEDFGGYPRDLTQDIAQLTDYSIDYIFAPTVEEMYPNGFGTYVSVEGVTDELEGAARPGHFRGVATVVSLLLNIVRPDFAFFGQKDYQQCVVVKRLARDLAFDTEIVMQPTVREESGLAMSSRNTYLNDEERAAASIIYRALKAARAAWKNGERHAAKLAGATRAMLETEPRIKVDYVSVNDAETLAKLERLDDDHEAVVTVAVKFADKVRLIDNFILNRRKE
ncbi:MAG: pantoate--beta-alanine ligase [Pyrinomonadaceae bacterium]